MDILQLADNEFSGSVLVRKGGKKLIEKAYGYADYSNKVPNEINTRFATASAGKVFVAVGVRVGNNTGRLGPVNHEMRMMTPATTKMAANPQTRNGIIRCLFL